MIAADSARIQYKKHIHSHEIYKIPIHYDSNTLYSLDNAYYFDKKNGKKLEKIVAKAIADGEITASGDYDW